MKPYAEEFYKSKAWKQCREAYARSKGGLCEKCLKDGRYTAGEIVHHKVHLSPENITDPNVSLNWDNLELLCRLHHAEAHGREKRYKVDEAGRVTVLG
jgi:5-methylcytosine-specific restriction endonuclease McrA